jgi:hypothetical protein
MLARDASGPLKNFKTDSLGMKKIEARKISQLWDPINFEACGLVFRRPAYALQKLEGMWTGIDDGATAPHLAQVTYTGLGMARGSSPGGFLVSVEH